MVPEVQLIIIDRPSENDVVLPSCTLHQGLFSQKNLLLEREEAKAIFAHDQIVRSQGLNEDIEGMM